MSAQLVEIDSMAEFEELMKNSGQKTQLLFKHSLTCPISARAFDEFEAYLGNGDERVDYRLVAVQKARDVSNEAEARLKVVHESPQAILVRDGKAVWHASHGRITRDSLAAAIRDHA